MGSTDRLDRLHIESVGKGENKYSTLQKVRRLFHTKFKFGLKSNFKEWNSFNYLLNDFLRLVLSQI